MAKSVNSHTDFSLMILTTAGNEPKRRALRYSPVDVSSPNKWSLCALTREIPLRYQPGGSGSAKAPWKSLRNLGRREGLAY